MSFFYEFDISSLFIPAATDRMVPQRMTRTPILAVYMLHVFTCSSLTTSTGGMVQFIYIWTGQCKQGR
jgi:hypothetical protein